VSVFIDQPFTTRASVLNFHAISFCASSGALPNPALTAGSALLIERLAALDTDALHML